MKIITKKFTHLHWPVKALLHYKNLADDRDVRVEAYDIDDNGRPINAHPLSINETKTLARSLSVSQDVHTGFLQYKGIIPESLLYVDTHKQGYALWYTPAQKVSLLFAKELPIPSGEAHIPPLVWRATAGELQVYALKSNGRPTETTHLFYAPFFNLYEDGRVCMGTIDIDIDEHCTLVDFMRQWEAYFWKSYFTHSLDGYAPMKGNLVAVWQEQVSHPEQPFPMDVLKKNGHTINDLIV